MLRSALLILGCTIGFFGRNAFSQTNVTRPAELVNPLVGSASTPLFSTGNTYPAIAMPWGMNFWTPQTGNMGNGWIYQYQRHKINGFRQTHQPSPWINDYGAFSLMPVTGKLAITEKERESWYTHLSEEVHPYYYGVYLGDWDVQVEITPTERAAQFRFTYPESDSSFLIIDGFFKGSHIKIDPESKKVTGYCSNNSGGVPENFHNYFIIEFDKPFTIAGIWQNKILQRNTGDASGEHVMGILQFKTAKGEKITARVASSFISAEQAALNLHREIGEDGFEQTKQKAFEAWNHELGKIQIEGGTLAQRRTFYTALYRTLLFPRKFYEFDANGKMIHYSPYNGEVLPGYMFTDNGFWDTFRAVFPFLTILHREMNSHIMQGLVNTCEESGWLPEWASPGHRQAMIGSNSASIIADSWIKGIRGYNINTLYKAILKNTENEGPVQSVGRAGATFYNELGYVPCDVKINESAARTLEYAYDDFTIWQLATALERPADEIDKFRKRAHNYKNLFDKTTGFMRGKNYNGAWQSPFNEFKWGDAFTEGNAWHYTWSVFHDPAGLAELMGGREAMEAKLDALFVTPPLFDDSYYGFQIHEITEMVVAHMGQYAHGNQPMQHGIYLYNYTGAPWKAQKWVRRVMDQLYRPQPDGLCGDEDNGQTSAWYVLSAMGFYPVCPGVPQYVIGSPLFDRVVMKLENGNSFEIIAHDNNRDNVFIRKALLNGKPYDKPWLSHGDIMKGGKLEFFMADKPNKQWGAASDNAPYSMSAASE